MHELVAGVLHDNGGVVGDALFLGEKAGHTDAPILQKRGNGLFRQLLPLGGKEAVILPEGKAARRFIIVALAEKALFTLHHVLTAARAHADDSPAGWRAGGRGRRSHALVGLDKRLQHIHDAAQEIGRGKRPALYLAQLFLPLSRQLCRFERVGQSADQLHAFRRGDKLLFAPFREVGLYQLFNDARAGGGRPQSGAFHVLDLGEILRAGAFHRGKQGVLGKAGGRARRALFYRGVRRSDHLPLGQRGDCRRVLLFLLFQRRIKRPLNGFPALGNLRSAGRRKQNAATFQRDGGIRILVGFVQRAQKARRDHVEDVPLSRRQGGKVGPADLRRGNNGVVVADLAVIHHMGGVDRDRHALGKGQCRRHDAAEVRQGTLHVIGQIARIGARVGRQLLFVKHLHIIERLLGGIVEQAVSLALKRGEVIELWRALRLFLIAHRSHRDGFPHAGGAGVLRVRLGRKPRADRPQIAKVQFHGIELLLFETVDRRLALNKQRQRRRDYAPDIQRFTAVLAAI